jgi:hypothetical protein
MEELGMSVQRGRAWSIRRTWSGRKSELGMNGRTWDDWKALE